jgi:hypothetical protein
MSSQATSEREFVDAVADQVASCVEQAVDRWMAEFDSILQDPHLTTLGRLQAIDSVVTRYRQLRGLAEASPRPSRHAAGYGVC